MNHTLAKNPVLSALKSGWAKRTPREQQLLRLAGAVLVLAAGVQWALAPAWRTWQAAPTQQARLDAQTLTMRQLQMQAQSLQATKPINPGESALWLENNLADLGPGAQIKLQGARATLSVQAAPAEALARWLHQARERALTLPVQAQLQQVSRSGPPANAPDFANANPAAAVHKPARTTTAPSDGTTRLRGTVVLSLP